MSNDDHKPMTEDQARKSDQGIGLPKDFDIDEPRASLGFKMVKSLLGQLDGRVTVLSNEPKGAAIHIEVPLDPFHHNE
jgi:two-component sensor histidine kinase